MKQFRSGCECDSFVCMQTSHAPCQKMRTLRPGIYRVMEGVSEESKADVAEEIASVAYRCRMCRLRLFSSEDIKYHKQAVHRLSQRGNKAKDAMPKGCSSHFIAEPMEWMHTDDVMGKINCPQCDARLGSYNWSGAQCSCKRYMCRCFVSVYQPANDSQIVWMVFLCRRNMGDSRHPNHAESSRPSICAARTERQRSYRGN